MANNYGLPSNALITGLGAKSRTDQLLPMHPLELSEKTFHNRVEQHDMAMLRKLQGLHAPLKLGWERKSVMKVGHLPFLPRHNVHHDVLTGRDESIGFEDFLGHPKDPEVMGQPHAMVEKHFSIL